jgi:hypothetical protein
MKPLFREFITSGVAGLVQTGLTREGLLVRLGEPIGCRGYPPELGLHERELMNASVWFYYDESVGVGFDDSGHSIWVTVYPEYSHRKDWPFEDSPFASGATMGEFRKYLMETNVPFLECDEGVHFILVAKRCYTFCTYYREGVELSRDERPILYVSFVERPELLPSHVQKYIRLDNSADGLEGNRK